MPRRPRADRPGRLHHVMNRGLARRAVFETRRDKRVFLALLARAVRAGRIELHAFVLLTTHSRVSPHPTAGSLARRCGPPPPDTASLAPASAPL